MVRKLDVSLIHTLYCEGLWLGLHSRFKNYIQMLQMKTALIKEPPLGIRSHCYP